MLTHERIKSIMLSKGMNAADFARAIDVKRANLSHVLSGRNKPSFDFIAKILTAFPNVNASWLILGESREEDMIKTDSTKDQKEDAADSNESDIEKVLIFYSDGRITEHQNLKKQ